MEGFGYTQKLYNLHHHIFAKAAAKTKFNLSGLSPTTDAARLHAKRSYHQVQIWLGSENDLLEMRLGAGNSAKTQR